MIMHLTDNVAQRSCVTRQTPAPIVAKVGLIPGLLGLTVELTRGASQRERSHIWERNPGSGSSWSEEVAQALLDAGYHGNALQAAARNGQVCSVQITPKFFNILLQVGAKDDLSESEGLDGSDATEDIGGALFDMHIITDNDVVFAHWLTDIAYIMHPFLRNIRVSSLKCTPVSNSSLKLLYSAHLRIWQYACATGTQKKAPPHYAICSVGRKFAVMLSDMSGFRAQPMTRNVKGKLEVTNSLDNPWQLGKPQHEYVSPTLPTRVKPLKEDNVAKALMPSMVLRRLPTLRN
ncbi:uncharacterized protein BO88DRAFT_430198 [Aspergillus vadensis CBS 113365]|uniref:Uncharacterized protein n=1 Tax=Aspergillus vadensis (strain CBS 113365 / IMI 142717 / IBT 24658) TaxID=1448311 RepID=A0A319BK49_ASPVC|nr:hypothetical protein BO88DRAFT_430198 [Aspergillus vadensis CBS 113365]PYH63668.1 hypothetical protein BO88DRAFT_430198 [Aspergillus vadensis CBS 113365]